MSSRAITSHPTQDCASRPRPLQSDRSLELLQNQLSPKLNKRQSATCEDENADGGYDDSTESHDIMLLVFLLVLSFWTGYKVQSTRYCKISFLPKGRNRSYWMKHWVCVGIKTHQFRVCVHECFARGSVFETFFIFRRNHSKLNTLCPR